MVLEKLRKSARGTIASGLAAIILACGGDGGNNCDNSPTGPGCTSDPKITAGQVSVNPSSVEVGKAFSVTGTVNTDVGAVVDSAVATYAGEPKTDYTAPYSASFNAKSGTTNGTITFYGHAGTQQLTANAPFNVTVTQPSGPVASNVTIDLLEDSVKTHNLLQNTTGHANRTISGLIDIPADVNVTASGSGHTFGGKANINGEKTMQYIVTNPDGVADTANVTLKISPMTDYRFDLRNFWSKSPLAGLWSMKINNVAQSSENGILQGQVVPGSYHVELSSHAGSFSLDLLELSTGKTYSISPKRATKNVSFATDFTGQVYRPSKADPHFNEQTLPSFLDIWDNEVYGFRAPLERNQTSYINTSSASGALNCNDMTSPIRNSWRTVQTELPQKFPWYTFTNREGTAPPTKTVNGFTVEADNVQMLCEYISNGSGTTFSEGGNRGLPVSNTSFISRADLGTARVEAFVHWAGTDNEDRNNRGFSFFDKNRIHNDLTPFDYKAIDLVQTYYRASASEGGEPFASLRPQE